MNQKKVKTMKKATVIMALVGCLTIGGISAYFTDADTATNEFTFGKVSLDLMEPDWDGEEKNVTPLQEIKKNPQIQNDGSNEEYVFLTVTVPYANVVTAQLDGTKNEATDTELFSYEINSGWLYITSTKNTSDKTITHLYAYAVEDQMTALAEGKTTPALFDKVTVANIVEDQNLELTTQQIIVNAYGIQTNNINGGVTEPASVWSVIANQAPSTTVTELENQYTDIKQ